MLIMVKTVIVMELSHWLWSKPTLWCILKLKTKEAPRRFWHQTDVMLLIFLIFNKAPRRLAGLNRHGSELRDVGCLTDI